MYSSNAATTKQERDQVEKCARDVLVLHFPVCADWLDDSSKQASNRLSLSTSPLPMCRWAAISEIVSQEWLRTTFLWTRIKSEAVLPRQRQPGCNSGDRAHRDWFRPSYWHPTSQNRRHQKGAWDCSRAFLWLCFLLLLSFLLMWPDFHVIFFHVLWTSFIFSLLLPWGRTEVLWDVCPPANTKKEPRTSTQRLRCAWSSALHSTVAYSNWRGISLRDGLDWRGGLKRGEGLITPFNRSFLAILQSSKLVD